MSRECRREFRDRGRFEGERDRFKSVRQREVVLSKRERSFQGGRFQRKRNRERERCNIFFLTRKGNVSNLRVMNTLVRTIPTTWPEMGVRKGGR